MRGRPGLQAPGGGRAGAYRRAASDTNAPAGTNSFADLGWWEVFQDPQLTAYIGEALTNNWDIKIAAARVLQAEAGVAHRPLPVLPHDQRRRRSGHQPRFREWARRPSLPDVNPQQEYGDVFVSMPAYEVDLWGRIRRANEAARAQLLATEEAQRTVRQTLVAAGRHGLPRSAGARPMNSKSPSAPTASAPIRSS